MNYCGNTARCERHPPLKSGRLTTIPMEPLRYLANEVPQHENQIPASLLLLVALPWHSTAATGALQRMHTTQNGFNVHCPREAKQDCTHTRARVRLQAWSAAGSTIVTRTLLFPSTPKRTITHAQMYFTHIRRPLSFSLSRSLARSPSLGDCRLLLHLPPSPLTRPFRRSAASSCVFRSFGHRFVCARTLPLHRRLYAPCFHLPPIKIGDDFHLKITTRPDLPCRAPKKETPPARLSQLDTTKQKTDGIEEKHHVKAKLETNRIYLYRRTQPTL